ncbi:MAG TPA: hypothetical protein VNW06_02185 [Cytophagaceae bacterium]|jgi:hypothetical protein|nr:hypothetical protein [Cytophagaceae bacterium]
MKNNTQNLQIMPTKNNVTQKMITENYNQIRRDVSFIIETEIGKLLDKKSTGKGIKRAKRVNKSRSAKGKD